MRDGIAFNRAAKLKWTGHQTQSEKAVQAVMNHNADLLESVTDYLLEADRRFDELEEYIKKNKAFSDTLVNVNERLEALEDNAHTPDEAEIKFEDAERAIKAMIDYHNTKMEAFLNAQKFAKENVDKIFGTGEADCGLQFGESDGYHVSPALKKRLIAHGWTPPWTFQDTENYVPIKFGDLTFGKIKVGTFVPYEVLKNFTLCPKCRTYPCECKP